MRFSQGDAASIGPALERLASNFPEIFKKTLNKAMASASESFGCLARREVDEAALPTLMRMIELAPVEELRRLASRVFPSWQLKSPSATFKNGKNCVALYQGFFARGCRLEDVFPCSPTPGKSLAQALKEKIEQCGRGELRDFFMSQWELVSLESQGAASAWEAKGLEPKAQERMLSLVSALEEAYPGEGAPRAIAWLEAHPALEALREAAPSPERKAPKSL